MKNFDFKKLLVFIVIILAIGLLIFGLFKAFKKDTVNKEDLTKIEAKINDYYSKLTYGYNTTYSGVDNLYKKDKTTLEDLEPNSIIKTSIRYAKDNGLEIQINNNILDSLVKSKKYGNEGDFIVHNAKGIREASLKLFGKQLPNQNVFSNFSFLSDYYYDKENDVYIEKKSKVQSNVDIKQNVEIQIIETTKEKDKIFTTVSVAYTFNENGKLTYAKDFRGVNIIAKDVTELNEKQKDKLDKYKFTLKKNDQEEYIFESIEKLK